MEERVRGWQRHRELICKGALKDTQHKQELHVEENVVLEMQKIFINVNQ